MTIQGTKGSVTSRPDAGTLYFDDQTPRDIGQYFEAHVAAEVKEAFFPRRITDSFALELLDWIRTIQTGKQSVNDGAEGLRDIGVSYGVIESSRLKQCVAVDDIVAGKIDGYQRAIDEHWQVEDTGMLTDF